MNLEDELKEIKEKCKDVYNILTSESLAHVANIGADLTYDLLSDNNTKSISVIPWYLRMYKEDGGMLIIRDVQYYKTYIESLSSKINGKVLLCKSSNTLHLNKMPENMQECCMNTRTDNFKPTLENFDLFMIENLNINVNTKIHKRQKEIIEFAKTNNKRILYVIDPHINITNYLVNLEKLDTIDPDIKWLSLIPKEELIN